MAKDHREYWANVGPRLHSFVEAKRDRAFEGSLVEAIALYSFVQEDFARKATRNQLLLYKIVSLIIVPQDVVRAVPAAFAELSPVALGALARVALEARVTLRFIATSPTPDTWADRYFRFGEVQKLLREQHRPQGEPPFFSELELEKARAACPEWVTPKGKLRTFWTADDRLRSVAQLAKEVGMGSEYTQVYGSTSAFVHAAAIVSNLYSGPTGIGCVGAPDTCKRLAFLATASTLDTIKEAAALFGVPFPEDGLALWRTGVLKAASGVL